MKFAHIILVLCIAIVFSACRKDTNGDQLRLVKDIVIANNECMINFTYDANNRLTSIVQCDTAETYVYSKDKIVYTKTAGGILTYKYIYTIGIGGLATGCTRLGGDGSIASYIFTYDKSGHRVSSVDTIHANTSDNYTIINDDIILDVSSSSVSGDGNFSISSIFYTDTKNTLSNDNFGLSFLGKSSANIKKADSYDNQQGPYTVTYTYVLDSQNGVSEIVSKTNGVVTDVRSYDYY